KIVFLVIMLALLMPHIHQVNLLTLPALTGWRAETRPRSGRTPRGPGHRRRARQVWRETGSRGRSGPGDGRAGSQLHPGTRHLNPFGG
ncbi:hypothetical protein FK513_30200, partial [Klebsiella pneumoniae]|nr:hypothetical protein [Klebsiella pneumoniae]